MTDSRIEIALAGGPIYEDATYNYFGEAAPGTALTDTKWRVSRMNILTKQIEWANVTNDKAPFNNLFTDLATVAALTYT